MKFDKYFFTLLIILLFGFLVRLNFTDFNAEVSSSDEGEYLVMAKSFLKGDIMLQWNYYRPFLFPLIWSGIFGLGLGENAVRIMIILFSLLSIVYAYLFARLLFNNKTIGLFSALFIAVFSQDIFFSTKILLNTSVLASWIVTCYYFYYGLINNSNKSLYLSAILAGISALIYSQNIVLFLFLLSFLIFYSGLNLFTIKKYQIFILLFFLVYILNFLYSFIIFGEPFRMFIYGLWGSYTSTEINGQGILFSIFSFFIYFPNYFGYLFLIFAILSLVIFFKPISILIKTFILYLIRNKIKIIYSLIFLILSLGLLYLIKSLYFTENDIIKQFIFSNIVTFIFACIAVVLLIIFRDYFNNFNKNILFKNLDMKYLFLFLWFITSLIGILKTSNHFEPRYLMTTLVPLFFLISNILYKFYKKIINFIPKFIGISFIIIILIFGSFFQILNVNSLIIQHNTTNGIKEGSYWINNNSNPDDLILGPWNFAITYYADRKFTYFPKGRSGNKDYDYFFNEVNSLKPSYLVLYDVKRHEEENYYYKQLLNDTRLQIDSLAVFDTSNGNQTFKIYKINY